MTDSQVCHNLGKLYAAAGDMEKALETLKRIEAAFLDMVMEHWLRRAREVSARVQG